MKRILLFICLPFLIKAQNAVGINQNFKAFIEYSQSSFLKDTIVLHRPYENPIRIPITKDNFGYKASLKGVFEYREELLRKDGYFTGRVFLKVFTDYRFRLEIEHSINKTPEKPYFMIPGVLYGSNNSAGKGKNIKFNYGKTLDKYITSDIAVRADRSSHPSVIAIKDNKVMMVACQEAALGKDTLHRISTLEPLFPYNGIFIYTSGAKQDKIGFSIGYKHIPFRYKGKQSALEKESFDTSHTEGWIEKKMGKVLTFKTLYLIDQATLGIRSYDKALRCYYKEFHEEPIARATRTEALEKLKKALIKDAWLPDKKYFYVTNDNQNEGDIAWTGGMQVAYPLLKAALKTNDFAAIDTVKKYCDEICTNAINPKSGLFQEAKVDGKYVTTGWWKWNNDWKGDTNKYSHTGYLNGQALYFLLKSYILTDKKEKLWFNTSTKILDKIALSAKSSGEIASYFDKNTGLGIGYGEFQGCWFVPAFALLYDLNNDIRYLNIAEKAVLYYYKYHLKAEVFGMPLDTYSSVDEEGNLAFIKACYELHRITRKMDYIRMAMDAFAYEFSWKFCYNSKHSNFPLRNLNFPTSGGSITSTHNVHIHQMGNLIGLEIYYFYSITKDPYLYQRLKDTSKWGLCTFNRFDGEFAFGKEGWATEQFYHSDAVQDDAPWDGGVWKKYLPWAASCVLLNVAEDIPDEFFE
ncbi:MAG: hypothetical protein EAZ53_13750 [Bacteroidetes bacterium]|nr:MAG: hypothetical protein EAZ53_13750 [Bacteroidota bacterium]